MIEENKSTSVINALIANVGLNAILRIPFYATLHSIESLSGNEETKKYVINGPHCETTDLLTPLEGHPGVADPRELSVLERGNLFRILDAGAYCASMSLAGYCGIGPAKSVFIPPKTK